VRIGVTDCYNEDKYDQYVEWIRSVDPRVEIVRLSHTAGQDRSAQQVDGLLLTGGGDVDPALYGTPDPARESKGVDRRRDEFELELIRQALEDERPILAVCRGMQVMNVALGGTLLVDLKSAGYEDHAGVAAKPIVHWVEIEANSLLSGLAGGLKQEVNSFHHQAVGELGKGLMPVARSADGVVEAAEWSLKEGMPFLLLVQWHPERMNGNVFSTNLAKIFLREIHYFTANKTP
jgi:putative glutamine amidotransferase